MSNVNDNLAIERPQTCREPVRIDLHVHSRFSSRPYSWFLRSAHSAECYTEPATVYKTAKLRGMNLVTLSDHDTIDGALELAALGPDTFISEEVSARFPEDGCIVHTIVSTSRRRSTARFSRCAAMCTSWCPIFTTNVLNSSSATRCQR